jgi:2-haloacid dehalogenase
VFVSSNRWDVMGAAAFGFRTVWVNRSQGPAEYDGEGAAHVVMPDLSGLPSANA